MLSLTVRLPKLNTDQRAEVLLFTLYSKSILSDEVGDIMGWTNVTVFKVKVFSTAIMQCPVLPMQLFRRQKHTSFCGKQHKNKPFMVQCSVEGENSKKNQQMPECIVNDQEMSNLFQMTNFILPAITLLYKAQLSLSVHLLLVKLNY